MAIYNSDEWLEKCELDAVDKTLSMTADDPYEEMRRHWSLISNLGYMRNLLFTKGIYKDITPNELGEGRKK